LCPSFFLPAGLRDDGVCPRGRRFSSRLVDRVRVSQLERRERKREPESGVYRGAPGGTRGPLATGILNVGGTTGAPPGCFSPAYLTYVPATFSSFPPYPPSAPSALLVHSITIRLLDPPASFISSFWIIIILSFFSLRNYLARSCLYEIRILDRRVILLFLLEDSLRWIREYREYTRENRNMKYCACRYRNAITLDP